MYATKKKDVWQIIFNYQKLDERTYNKYAIIHTTTYKYPIESIAPKGIDSPPFQLRPNHIAAIKPPLPDSSPCWQCCTKRPSSAYENPGSRKKNLQTCTFHGGALHQKRAWRNAADDVQLTNLSPVELKLIVPLPPGLLACIDSDGHHVGGKSSLSGQVTVSQSLAVGWEGWERE